MRILVVEDNLMLALDLKDQLERAGYEVLGPADTFKDAVELARRCRPELALVNIDLSNGDSGIDVAKTLRDDLDCPSLFVSGSWSEARQAKDIALGFIAKPYNHDLGNL